MGDSSPKLEENENDLILWKNRELSLRTRVLQSQLTAARQAKEVTLEISKSTSESIQSIKDDKQLRLHQQQLLLDKQTRLEQLNVKLGFAKSQIFSRCRGMIHELWAIYPIVEFPDRKGYSICDIHLPSMEHFEGHDEFMVTVAIGYVGHLLLMLSEILDITLRFPLKYFGSKIHIFCNRRNQLFPLFVESFKSREWVNFSYGMSLLNLDIVQIRTLYGLSTNEPDETLANLHSLKLLLDSEV